MAVLGKFTKQPADVQDYDIDFTEYLTSQSDTAVSHTVAVETGITIVASALASGVVKTFLSGGTNGQQYKLTATITTAGGRVKQAEIIIKVKEY